MLGVLPPMFEPVLQQIRLPGFVFVCGKTRNLASIQFGLRQSRKEVYP